MRPHAGRRIDGKDPERGQFHTRECPGHRFRPRPRHPDLAHDVYPGCRQQSDSLRDGDRGLLGLRVRRRAGRESGGPRRLVELRRRDHHEDHRGERLPQPGPVPRSHEHRRSRLVLRSRQLPGAQHRSVDGRGALRHRLRQRVPDGDGSRSCRSIRLGRRWRRGRRRQGFTLDAIGHYLSGPPPDPSYRTFYDYDFDGDVDAGDAAVLLEAIGLYFQGVRAPYQGPYCP